MLAYVASRGSTDVLDRVLISAFETLQERVCLPKEWCGLRKRLLDHTSWSKERRH